jgi:hypothetical protein
MLGRDGRWGWDPLADGEFLSIDAQEVGDDTVTNLLFSVQVISQTHF